MVQRLMVLYAVWWHHRRMTNILTSTLWRRLPSTATCGCRLCSSVSSLIHEIRSQEKWWQISYVAELKRLSDFGGALDEMSRDHLVWGIADLHIQHRLLPESSLTFVKAMEIAQAVTLATWDLKDLQSASTSSIPVQKLEGQRASSNPSASKSHLLTTTVVRNTFLHTASSELIKWCQSCSKVGNTAKMCWSKSKDQPQGQVEARQPIRWRKLPQLESTPCTPHISRGRAARLQ